MRKSRSEPKDKSTFTVPEIKLRMEAYCAYRDRCTSEVEKKLREYTLTDIQSAAIVEELRTRKFLDDVRFAHSFVSGKFRFNQWGRIRIRMELRLRKISDTLIKDAIQSMDLDAYAETITSLVERKYRETERESDVWKRKAKVIRFLSSRGFEQDLIMDAVESVFNSPR
jgi:regulatory protein